MHDRATSPRPRRDLRAAAETGVPRARRAHARPRDAHPARRRGQRDPAADARVSVDVPRARCPHCGEPVGDADQFCESCGQPLGAAVPRRSRSAEPAPGRPSSARSSSTRRGADDRRPPATAPIRPLLVRRRDRRRRLVHDLRPARAERARPLHRAARAARRRGLRPRRACTPATRTRSRSAAIGAPHRARRLRRRDERDRQRRRGARRGTRRTRRARGRRRRRRRRRRPTRIEHWNAQMQRRGRAPRRPRPPTRPRQVGNVANPPSCTFVAAVVDGPLARRRVDRRQPRLLVRRRRHRDPALDRRLVGDRRDRPGRRRARSPRPTRGPTRSPAGSGSTAPAATRRSLSLDGHGARVGCSSAATGSGTTAPTRSTSATSSRDTSAARGDDPLAVAGALVDWANAQGGHDNITAALRTRRHLRILGQGDLMANWTAEVFENEYLPADATDVHAIVTVTCSDAGTAGSVGRRRGRDHHRRHVGIDGVAAHQDRRRRASAAAAAIDAIVDGTWFAVIVGQPRGAAASTRRPAAWCRRASRPAARPRKRCVTSTPAGGTAIGSWLRAAVDAVRHGRGRATARDPADRRRERDREAGASCSGAIGAADRRVPVRLPRRRRRLGGQRAARASRRRCSDRSTSSPSPRRWPTTSGR